MHEATFASVYAYLLLSTTFVVQLALYGRRSAARSTKWAGKMTPGWDRWRPPWRPVAVLVALVVVVVLLLALLTR